MPALTTWDVVLLERALLVFVVMIVAILLSVGCDWDGENEGEVVA